MRLWWGEVAGTLCEGNSVCVAGVVSWLTGVDGVKIIVFMFTIYMTVHCCQVIIAFFKVAPDIKLNGNVVVSFVGFYSSTRSILQATTALEPGQT